jgi:hypothetical protein
MDTNSAWGTDTPISMPVPPVEPQVGSLAAGFAYTRFGIVHDITTSDVEGYLLPTFMPLDSPERQ